MAKPRLNRPQPEQARARGKRLNRTEICGRLIERKVLRYTPAGLPVSEGRIEHRSTQLENGAERLVEVEIAVLAVGENARWLEASPLGGMVRIAGFLAARSQKSRSPVLHVNTIEYLEGNENGSILQEG